MHAQDPFSFETAAHSVIGSHRTDDDNDYAVLLIRFGIRTDQTPKVIGDFEQLLRRYCVDVLANISWYEGARKKLEGKLEEQQRGIWLIAIAVLALASIPAFFDKQVVAPQVGVTAVLLIYVLQILGGMTDRRAQLGAFRKALSELKEGLYTLEQKHHGKVFDEDGKVSILFETALWDALRDARRILREEGDAYFATFKSPSEIATMLNGAVGALSPRVTEVSTARRLQETAAIAAEKPRAEARQKLLEADAAVAAAEATQKALLAAKAAQGDLAEAEKTLTHAKGEVVRCQTLVLGLAKEVA